MRFVSRTVLLLWGFAVMFGGAAILSAQQHDAATHQHPEAAKLKNPVASNAASIAAGKKLYDAQCASCHGTTGKGDGKGGLTLKPRPSDLTDAEWKHGASDGEVFTLIRDGAQKTAMRGYGSKMTTNDLWNIVNYLRTLNPKTAKSQ